MLQTLREKTSGWFATVLLAALTVPFAFFGIDQYLTQHNETFVARLQAPPSWWPSAPATWPVTMLWQTDTIEADEFRTALERARQSARQRQGDNFDPRAFESAENKRTILDQLIDQHVLQMTADRQGIAVSDAQVRSTILGIPAFQGDNGQFDKERYQQALASQGLTPTKFDQQVRDSLGSRLIPEHVAQSAFVTKTDMQRIVRLLGEKRDVAFVTLPAPAPDTAPVSAQDIQRWYDAHPASYRAAETVSLEYVDIDGSTLPVAATTDEASLRQRYEQEKARFVQPEQRLASHILVKVPEGASAAAQKAAEAKAQQLAAQARQPGADFAALARADSEDTGSKAGGGDLGWVTKGQMVKPFEDALFAMKPGDVSAPVKSQFGWHVIQLREVKAGAQTPFEQVRDQLAKEQADADREHAFNDLVGKIVDQVYKNPTSLAPAARSAGLAVQKLGPFARGQGSGIAANPALQRTAFSESAIQDGTVSDPIEIGPNHSVLIRVVGHTEAHQRPLAEVAPQVIAAVRADRARRAAEASADQLVAALRQGKPLAELATARGMPAPSQLPSLPRNVPLPDPKTNEAVFAVQAPAAGQIAPGKAVLDDGRIVVFIVTRVTPGSATDATPEQLQSMQQQVAGMTGEADALALVAALRKRMQVTVAEDRL
jgi:peptidyl-prolyl cis-trans isomerase D